EVAARWTGGFRHRGRRGRREPARLVRVSTMSIHFVCDARHAGDWRLLHAIVRGFASDDHVVDVAFAETRCGDADETGFLGELPQRASADVAHAALKAPDELVR